MDENITFVSLGSHCEIAVHLNANHLRRAAFPFDWLLTCKHEHFCRIFDDNFVHFLDEHYFTQHPKYQYVIENSYYEIEFRHDWPFPDLWSDMTRFGQQLEEMKQKYERRIHRFRQLRDYPGKVFFIRAAYDFQNDPNHYWGNDNIDQINAIQAQDIRDALKRYFPALNFTLVIVNYLEENVPTIKWTDKIIEFKIRKSNKQEDYASMFNFLLLLNNQMEVDSIGFKDAARE